MDLEAAVAVCSMDLEAAVAVCSMDLEAAVAVCSTGLEVVEVSVEAEVSAMGLEVSLAVVAEDSMGLVFVVVDSGMSTLTSMACKASRCMEHMGKGSRFQVEELLLVVLELEVVVVALGRRHHHKLLDNLQHIRGESD